MGCHADLPGFYFDPVRNKYFKLLKRHHRGVEPVKDTSFQVEDSTRSGKLLKQAPEAGGDRAGCGLLRLLRTRETVGINSFSFEQKWMEALASEPQIHDYGNLGPGVIADFEQLCVGPFASSEFPGMNVLLSGNKMGTIQLWEVIPSSSARHPENSLKTKTRNSVPRQQYETSGCRSVKGDQWAPPFLSSLPSSRELGTTITAVKRLQGCDQYNSAVVAGLGSSVSFEGSGNAGLLLLRLLQTDSGSIRITRISRYKPQVEMWTAESDPEGRNASVGLQTGAAVISLEDGAMHNICRGNTVLAQEFDKTGNVITCGFRKGLIFDVDKRASPVRLKDWNSFCEMNMRSPVCSIVGLESNEHHLLASSMDGQIKRWDRRSKRVPIISYEGNVNSSTKLQLGVDHAEALVFCGGEDGALRMWSLRSGRLLHTGASLPGPVTSMRRPRYTDELSQQRDFVCDHSWAMWMSAQTSPQSIVYVHSFPV